MAAQGVSGGGAQRAPPFDDPGEAISETLVQKRPARPSLDDAFSAWFAGDFEQCLALCELVRRRDPQTRTHLGLLKARALIRLERPDEALRVLHDTARVPCGRDESLTLRMLTANARLRRGEVTDGLRTLLELQRDAGSAHRTLRSEIALNIAVAHYGLRAYDAAEAALQRVDADADIVSARALEVRGWIAVGRMQWQRAATNFSRALETFDRCRHHDRNLEANCVRALAHIALERMDRATWSLVDERRGRMDWTASGLSDRHFWITYCAAGFALDVEGRPLEAAREARAAEDAALGPALRVAARCKRAAVARVSGESVSQRDHLESAAELFRASDPERFTGDETNATLVLAEELAEAGLVSEARAALDLFARTEPRSPMLSMARAPSTHALFLYVEGRLLEAASDAAAGARFRAAFDAYKKMGYTRRATMAALGCARTSSDRKPIAYAERATAHLAPASWMRRRIESTRAAGAQLTAVQREVLTLICQGKSNPEIARARKRSLHTIRNLVARLFEVMDVNSREELAVECVRRGLYVPERRENAS